MAEDLLVLSELIRREFGMNYAEHLDQLARKMIGRLEATQTKNVAEYLRLLKTSPTRKQELLQLADNVTNNETYFFREQTQLSIACNEIIPTLLADAQRAKPIKILSLPCSTGEEPYSLAMNLVINNQPFEKQIEIYGADISLRALHIAQKGQYRSLAFRGVAPAIIERFFHTKNGLKTIDPHIQRLVTFFHANVIDPKTLQIAAPYDMIFCRNVMIYFDAETQRKALDSLYSVLAPSGYLCLGHADEAGDLHERFDIRTYLGTMVYRRKKYPQSMMTGAA